MKQVVYFEAAEPDDINFTLTITLPLKEWNKIRQELRTNMHHGPHKLREAIYDILQQARKTFYPKENDK